MGEPTVPRPWLEAALSRSLVPVGGSVAPPRVRIVRSEQRWALVEVEHTWLSEARRTWNGPVELAGRRAVVLTHRTWGTLKDAKAWLRQRPDRPARAPVPRAP